MQRFQINNYLYNLNHAISFTGHVSDVTSLMDFLIGFGRESKGSRSFFCETSQSISILRFETIQLGVNQLNSCFHSVNYRTSSRTSHLYPIHRFYYKHLAFQIRFACSTYSNRIIGWLNYFHMKQIKLIGINRQKDGYCVYLGNGTQHTFSSEKKALRFLAITNQFLTQKLYEIRAIYIEAWIKFQNNWGYFEHNKPSMSSDLRQMQRGCEESFKTCEDRFNIIIDRDDWTNGNFFAFKNLFTVCASLKDAALMLNSITRKRSSTFELYAIDNLFSRICSVEKEIKEYSAPGALWYFKNAMHLQQPEHINIPKPAFA